MTLTALDIYDRLTDLDSDEDNDFTLTADTSEADVQAWIDSIDVSALEVEADAQIDRTPATDLTEPQGIGGDDLAVADGDVPEEAVIRPDDATPS